MKNLLKFISAIIVCLTIFNVPIFSSQSLFALSLIKNDNVKNMKITLDNYPGTYSGSINTGKPDGYGIFKSSNTQMGWSTVITMEGTWKGNHVTKGTLTIEMQYPSDSKMETKYITKGNFINMELVGKGETYNYINGVIKESMKGSFSNGRMNGYCKITEYKNGKVSCTYKGNYKNSHKILTLTDYNKIKIAMGYKRIKQILGGDGQLIDESHATKTYMWKFPQNYNIVVTFKDGKVMKKSQKGLR